MPPRLCGLQPPDGNALMQVTEIFRSIQGESTFAGLPCIFIRLTGCNLRCVWCDTAYAFYGGKKMSVEQVLTAVRDLSNRSGGRPVRLVEVTGGEPLLQQEVYPLIDRLLVGRYQVLIETSGERPIRDLPSSVVRIVDVKCPDSGEGGSFLPENLACLASHDQLKFVLASPARLRMGPRVFAGTRAARQGRGRDLLAGLRANGPAPAGRMDSRRRPSRASGVAIA